MSRVHSRGRGGGLCVSVCVCVWGGGDPVPGLSPVALLWGVTIVHRERVGRPNIKQGEQNPGLIRGTLGRGEDASKKSPREARTSSCLAHIDGIAQIPLKSGLRPRMKRTERKRSLGRWAGGLPRPSLLSPPPPPSPPFLSHPGHWVQQQISNQAGQEERKRPCLLLLLSLPHNVDVLHPSPNPHHMWLNTCKGMCCRGAPSQAGGSCTPYLHNCWV